MDALEKLKLNIYSDIRSMLASLEGDIADKVDDAIDEAYEMGMEDKE